jgi:AraC family transcriptional regulator
MKSILYIKNMVCPRCLMAVEAILHDSDISFHSLELGKVKLKEEISTKKLSLLASELSKLGFELLLEEKKGLTNNVKSFVIERLYSPRLERNQKLSDLLSKSIGKDYSTISKVFSQTEGTTIEKYIIKQKIERVKELLSYGELSLSEIAFKLHYSSSSYLSNQFKAITGVSPSNVLKLGKR